MQLINLCILICVAAYFAFLINIFFQDKSKRTQGSEPRGSVYLMVSQMVKRVANDIL